MIQASASESECFISYHFKKLKDTSTMSSKTLSFQSVSLQNTQDLFRNLDFQSSMGETGLSPLIFKDAEFCSIITLLFCSCITSNCIPKDWKKTIVTQLYKNKGDLNDIIKYRAIAVLPLIAKLSDNVVASQIVDYFDENNQFFKGQYGFRNTHSCETALHEIYNAVNTAKDDRLLSLLLFIDFKKLLIILVLNSCYISFNYMISLQMLKN
jgi:hypothetical protein